MPLWLSAVWTLRWGSPVGILSLAGAVLLLGYQRRVYANERRRDRRIREEFEAYARLDASLRGADSREAAKTVCRAVAKRSAFQRVALLMKDSDGQLRVRASIGIDETTARALHAWGERVLRWSAGGDIPEGRIGIHVGERSLGVVLSRGSAGMGCGRAIVIPLRTSAGEMAGVLAVCADRMMLVRRRTVEETIRPLEMLAWKLGRTMDEAGPAERPQCAQEQKLTGQELPMSRVAGALNHPLTAVLGFAELIAETTKEPRVRSDANKIVQEAQRMRQTVQNLLILGQPAAQAEEPVEIAGLVRELAIECAEKLNGRGIRLVVEAGDDVPTVQGNGEKLRHVLEHLLDNAAQAIDSVADGAKREHEIRVSVSHDLRSVQVIVSDSGPGFTEPGKVFDPLPTPSPSGDSARTELNICQRIVREEHRGEINAFNLHPYGAAVVMELPLGKAMGRELSGATREVA